MAGMLRGAYALGLLAIWGMTACTGSNGPLESTTGEVHTSPGQGPPARRSSVIHLTQAQRALPGAPRDLRVMSFNVRVAIFIDGPNHWDFRKERLVQSIRNFHPDLLGTQEAGAAQTAYLREQLPEYNFVGAGRADGKLRGEMCGVFFKRSRFEKLSEGHFWLSKKSEVPGSKSWGTRNTRMVTWVKLRDRGDGSVFCLFNTHFDHKGKRAREQSAKLLRQKIDTIAGSLPVIITGDFNADADSKPYRTIINGSRRGDERFIDTFRAANSPIDPKHDGTRHAFRGGQRGRRIDWIITSQAFRTLTASIDHTKYGRRYPSDHFPITAIVRPASASQLARLQ